MKGKNTEYITVFIVCFILIFLISFFVIPLTVDDVWCYGFSYNISKGLIPYRDFNMIVTPFYSYILALFIKIFGNHIIFLSIFNAIIQSCIMTLAYKKIGKKALLLFPLLIFFISNDGYNMLSLLEFFVLIEVLKSSKSKKYFYIGLVTALLVLTKQTVGGLIFIVFLFSIKEKKEYLSGFIPICLLFFLYLIISDSFVNFWNYCLFGMLDFSKENSLFGREPIVFGYLLILLFFIIVIIHNKRYKNNEELKLIMTFQIMAFPILDSCHIIISIIPLIVYIIENNDFINKQIKLIIIVFFFSFSFTSLVNDLLCKKEKVYYPNFLRYKASESDFSNISLLDQYIDGNYSDYELYLFSDYAYIFKIGKNQTTNKYDLINNGNMGYHGSEKYILEIKNNCSEKKCLFVLNSGDNQGQKSKKILKYVEDNFEKKESTYTFDLYTN